MKAEAKEKFERWHARQRELGACRCAECRAAYPEKPEHRPASIGIWFDTVDKHEGEVLQFPDDFMKPVAVPREVAIGNEEERADAAYRREAALIGPPSPLSVGEAVNLGAAEREKLCRERVLAGWGKAAKAPGAGSYERNREALIAYEQKLAAREHEVIDRQYRADDRECRAEKARLTYEQARARLEAEFGADVVGKSIAALERILTLQKEFAALGEQVEDVVNSVATVHSAVDDLGDESSILVEKFEKLKRKISGQGD